MTFFKLELTTMTLCSISSYQNDTAKLFNYNVDDAVDTALRLDRKIENDTLFIEINMPTDEQSGVTAGGTKYCLTPKVVAHKSSFKK
ncbi:MAG TPA: hypothetical protein VM871_09035 [Flavisolibacter sp.]|jgi:hypothetical protein|nr:hypothetical protein [Flavisolibacter sp.]